MLNDKKLKRFADSFPVQWLQIERIFIISSLPDKEILVQNFIKTDTERAFI